MKVQQVKQSGEKEEKGEREHQINGVREGAFGQKWKWHGLEMDVGEKGHLSIFSKANQ